MHQNISRYFNTMKFIIRASESADQMLKKRLGTGFSCFDWMPVSETLISSLMREFLDTKGSHGQGAVYLKLFLELFSNRLQSANAKNATVTAEALTYSLNRPRRIDLLIDFGSATGGIAIENKPWAAEQEDQLDDYIDHMVAIYGDKFEIIYLNGKGVSPTSLNRNKLIAEKSFIQIDYNNDDLHQGNSDLKAWIISCALHTDAPKVREFLNDFAHWIEENF